MTSKCDYDVKTRAQVRGSNPPKIGHVDRVVIDPGPLRRFFVAVLLRR